MDLFTAGYSCFSSLAHRTRQSLLSTIGCHRCDGMGPASTSYSRCCSQRKGETFRYRGARIRRLRVVPLAAPCSTSDLGDHYCAGGHSDSAIHCRRSHAVVPWPRHRRADAQLGKHAVGISAVSNREFLLVDGIPACRTCRSFPHLLYAGGCIASCWRQNQFRTELCVSSDSFCYSSRRYSLV